MRVLLFAVLFTAFGPLCGCSPAARSTVGSVASGVAQGTNTSETVKLMIFGGVDHKTYLGCLNCSQYAADSVNNEFGPNGSRYASESIWNHYGEYGSAFSMYGACNAYATDPPVIVDGFGKYYGRLSLNRYHAELGLGARYYSWLSQTVCESN